MDVNSFVIGYTKGKQSASGGSGGSGGGVELNIAYGDTPPEDTSKLWVKTSEPSGVVVSKDVETVQGSRGVIELSKRIPVFMYSTVSASKDSKIYLFGYIGGSSGYDYYSTIHRFDTNGNELVTLTEKVVSARARVPNTVVTVGTKIYLFGGSDGNAYSGEISCFDTVSEICTTLPVTFNNPLVNGGSAIVKDNKVYLVGGVAKGKGLYCFDTDTDTYTTLSEVMSESRIITASATVGNKAYLFGGYWNDAIYNTILCFDADTELFTTLQQTVPSKYHMRASAIGDKIYLFGGISNYSITADVTCYDTIYCFDTKTETLTELEEKLPIGQGFATAQTVNNRVYLFGGRLAGKYSIQTESTATLSKAIYRFAEESVSLIQDIIQIVPTDENIFPIINTETTRVEIGVGKVYKGNTEGIGEPVETAICKDGAWTTI